jgi:hypothetical protein
MSHSELNYIFKDENNYFLNIFIVNLTFEKTYNSSLKIYGRSLLLSLWIIGYFHMYYV